jgi:hypothetical protein
LVGRIATDEIEDTKGKSPNRAKGGKAVGKATAAGLTDRLLSMSDLAEMVEAAMPKPGERGPYKKRIAA